MRFYKDPNCIFCKIVAGEAEASVVYEDNQIMSFMTLKPSSPGELLVVPKSHIDHFTDMPNELASRIMVKAQEIARAVRAMLRPVRMGYVVHGFGVPHAHLIVVPLHRAEDITSASFARVEDGEIKFEICHIPDAPREELDEMAERLRMYLESP